MHATIQHYLKSEKLGALTGQSESKEEGRDEGYDIYPLPPFL